jgi:hypothetical protein
MSAGGRQRPGYAGRRRELVNLTGAQAGDVGIGQAAGGNIQHGTDSDLVLGFFKEYVFLDRQEREKRVQLKDTHDKTVIISLVVIIVLLGLNAILLLIVLEAITY